MGQTIGRAPLPIGGRKFMNLPRSCIYDLWEAFNDIAEGFGLTVEEFQEIIKSALLEFLRVTERQLNSDSDTVFRLLDDDSNNLVDSLEFISTFALISAMTPEEKIRFIFAMYDFDESGVLTLDEMVLSFRSSLSGLAKLTKIDPPTETEVETIVVLGFDMVRSKQRERPVTTGGLPELLGIDREAFVSFCLNTPEVLSWLEYFDDMEEFYSEILSTQAAESILVRSNMRRSAADEALMSPSFGGSRLRLMERKGRAGSKKPWQNALPFLLSKPASTAAAAASSATRPLPHKKVELEWVYGYNGHSSTQALHYSAKGSIIYPAGALCIVQDLGKHEQKFFSLHTDLVTCIKVFHTAEGDTIVASGEVGVRPSVLVWDCESRRLLSTLQGFHRNGVAQLDFSPDNSRLATLGMDPYHSIAVYLWRTKERVWSVRSTCEKVLDLRFLSRDFIASCGEAHVLFWKRSRTEEREVYKRYRGQLGPGMKVETHSCVGSVGEVVFTCSALGFLHRWEGRNLMNSVRGHTSGIRSCYVLRGQGDEQGLVTGCNSGKVVVWTNKLEVGASFNGLSLGAVQPAINALCYDSLTSKILLSFTSCEIFEIDSTDGRNVQNGGSVVSAHFHPRVCGLDVHPKLPNIFVSVGDDKTVRIFDAVKRRQRRVTLLDSAAHSCAFSPDGQMILVGLGLGLSPEEGAVAGAGAGAEVEERKEGAFIAVSEEDLTLLYEARDSRSAISDIKFSPNGEKFCMSSLDGCLYVYNTKKFVAKAKCRGHSGRVTHVDFSANNKFLMSNCTADELLFWDAESGELQPPKLMKGVQWDTNSCVNSFATQGILDPLQDGTVCNMACRSNAQDLLVVVDNYGRVRVTDYPCLDGERGAAYLTYGGHAKDVKNVKMACDDSRFFTVGGTDGAILQWRLSLLDNPDTAELKKVEAPAEAFSAEMKFEGKLLQRPDIAEDVLRNVPSALCEMEEGLVDVSQVLPWQKNVVAPSRVPTEDLSEPPDALQLEFLYGFTADISRQSVLYSAEGELLFFSAAAAASMDQKQRSQRFYTQHRATVTAMAVNKVDGVVATGDQGELPSIRVWSSSSLQTLAVLEGFHRRAIAHLKFSSDGALLASVGQDDFHSVGVYDWKNGYLLCRATSFEPKSLCLEFNPNGTGLVQGGNEIIRFWDLDGRLMHYQDAILGSRAKLQPYLSAGWVGGHAVMGTTDGCLYRFLGNKLDSIVQAHSAAINCIAHCSDGLCTASMDGSVKLWTRYLECRLIIEAKYLKTISSNIRCVDWDFPLARLLIGTASGEVLEVGAGDGENLHGGPLLEGHGGDELWGLAANPTKEEFCTVGDDALLRMWNVFSHECVKTVALEMPARCCAFSPDGRRLAVGFGSPRKLSNRQFDGKWIVLDTTDFQMTHEARDSTKWLTDMKYSPNGELLAIGGYDHKIYIYSVNSGYALNGVVGQHQSFITAFDFSEDSLWLRSNCGGFELFYFEADTGLYIPAAARLRDTVWATQTCSMTWQTQGLWAPQKDGTDITACDCNLFRGDDGPVAVAGDNYGRVRLFRYPSTSSFCCSKLYWASSNPITRLKLTCGDSVLLTLSGKDKSIMQWTLSRDREDAVAHDVVSRRGKLEEDDDDVVGLFSLQDPALDGKGGGGGGLNDLGLGHLVNSRPWMAAIITPTTLPADIEDGSAAKKAVPASMAMNHVLGMQCQYTRNSVRYTNQGDILLPASKYVCVFNKKGNSQSFYTGHRNEMSCVAVSRDGLVAASAERTDRPSIHLWDTSTCILTCALPYLHRRGVVSMQFSDDRRKLVSVGADQDHSIALWLSPSGQWTTDAHLLAWNKGDVNPTLFCSFYQSSDGSDSALLLGSGGRFHLKFWKLQGRCLNPVYPEYDRSFSLSTVLCGAAVGGRFACGSVSGHLFIWTGRKLERAVRAHELGITCVWGSAAGALTCSKDGVIKQWTLNLEHVRSFTLSEADVPPLLDRVRSLDGQLAPAGGQLNCILACTASGEVYEISAKTGSMTLVHEAHYFGQLWGLCVHPTDPDLFATTGDDKTIRIWSVGGRRLLRKAVIDSTARSVHWSPDGQLLLVGLGGSQDGKKQRKDGAFLMLDARTMKPLFEGRDSRHWLPDVKFSPDGKCFSLASMDHKIYIYDRETFRLKGTCDRHNSHVKGFDYSQDSVYIQSDSGDYEHLYFEAEDGEYFSSGSQLKDIQWADWTCLFGWPVQGAWPYFNDIERGLAAEPSAVHRSPGQDLLAVGDQSGALRLMNYPAVFKEAPSFKLAGHVKEVSKVRFSCDGSHMISLGKMDRCIILWKVDKSAAK